MEYTVGGVLVLLLLISPKDASAFEVKISRNPIPVGENVTLELIPQTVIESGVWFYESQAILIVSGGTEPAVTDRYRGRIVFDAKTWALTLENVTLADYGSYTLQGINPTITAKATLHVLEPISEVNVSVSGPPPIQNQPFTLRCVVTGLVTCIQWLRDGLRLSADNRIVFSADNSSVTFTPVQRSDDGSYQCKARNAVSNGTSPGYQLLVNYGPEQPVVTGPDLAKTGSNVTFTCSAVSQPPSQYSWYFNGTRVAQGSVYVTAPLALANQGRYTCEAFNSITRRNSTAVTELTVIAPITSVLVNSSGGLPIDDMPFTFVCEVNGQANYIQWLRDGLRLSADKRIVFSADNSSVTFTPVQRSDDGSYQCKAHNAVSNGTSPGYQLLVNYGPEQPVVTGPDLAKTGSNVTFTCSALSQPPSQYSWYFNGTRVAQGSVYVIAPLALANQGRYTCEAFNSITGRNSTAVTELTVIAPITSVLVNSSGGLPIDDKPFTLVCKVNGQANYIQWLRDGLRMSADKRIVFSADNSSVTFTPVLRSDDGSYQCKARNTVNNGTSPGYQLLVNYGPEQPVITGPDLAKTGSNVTFTCSALSQPSSQYSWYFNGTRVADSSAYVTPPLTLANQGRYTCWASNRITGRNSTAVTELTVIAPITSVLVNSSGGLPVEDKPFTLVCEVNGQANYMQWLRDRLHLSGDKRIVFSADNSSVTFTPVLRSDDGSYQCKARNAVSNGTSPGYQLLVNYGPEQPVVTGPDLAKTGSNVTFTCSALSQPPSQYIWYFNGTRVAQGSVYVIAPLTLANQGMYTCEAFNSITRRNSTAVTLTAIAPITSVLVNSSGGLPVEDKPFTLLCKVNEPANYIQWLRDDLHLSADKRIVFSADNSSVTFTPVQRSDDGSYQCKARNAVSNDTSPGYQLLVNYGPEQPVITGPDLAATGSKVNFTCSALSQPNSQYIWYFNGTRVAQGSVHVIAQLTPANQGTYTCDAFNSITGRNSTAVKELKVIARISSVLVNSSGGLPVDDKPFTLVCKVNGEVNYMQWLRDGLRLSADKRLVFSADNSSVTFTPVLRSDDGSYQCKAHNALSNGTSPGYQLLVNYGPEKPVITGPDVEKTGSKVNFTCSALSQPPSQYIWYFNYTRVAQGSVHVITQLTPANQGTYTCDAFNSITGRNSTAVTELKVIGSSAVSKGSLFLAALGISLLQLTNWLSC